jgi:NSS family neurotransmitter:Na+ symporter
MALLGEEEGGSRQWGIIGVVGVGAGFLILSYYSVIAGWALAYVFQGGSGAFEGADADRVGQLYLSLTGNWAVSGLWHTAFMGLTIVVVAGGVERGLERAVRVLMPALVALLLVLLGYSMIAGDFAQGVAFLFQPKFADLTPAAALSALGHAFFTLSVGMGAIMAYGAYLPDEASIARTSVAVVVADTAIALLAGLVIFPIVFAHGLDPATGPGLIFQTLPLAFGQLPAGVIIAVIFFLLLTFAAWTSAISLMEPAVAWIMERWGLSRRATATLVGSVIWLLGLGSVLSFNVWSNLELGRGSLFSSLDFLTSNLMLPLGGLAIVVFAGWVMSPNSTSDELDPQAGLGYRAWRIGARFVAPVGVLLIFLNVLGII